MEYGLKRLVLGSTSFLPISLERYQSLEQAKLYMREAYFIEQKFDFVIENYIEFEQYLCESSIDTMVVRGQNFGRIVASRAIIDRRIMNLISTASSYVDSTPQHVNNFYEKSGKKTEIINKYFSEEYDSRLGYRVMCKLRNFILHQGLPVHSSGSSWHKFPVDESEKVRFTVNPYLNTKELKAGKFHKGILKELESKGEKFDIKLLIREYIEGLSIAHNKVRLFLDADLENAEKELKDAIYSFEVAFPSEGSIIGLSAVRVESANIYVDEIAIFNDLNEYRINLRKKNPELSNLSKRYISSEVINN